MYYRMHIAPSGEHKLVFRVLPYGPNGAKLKLRATTFVYVGRGALSNVAAHFKPLTNERASSKIGRQYTERVNAQRTNILTSHSAPEH